MKNTLKYSCSLLLILLILCQTNAQDKRIRGLRIGYDLSRLALYYIEPERTAMEFSADMEIFHNFYAAAEYGIQDVDYKSEIYNYMAEGSYFRIGFDKNYLKKLTINQYEMLYGGLRYGYASYRHSANNINISDEYWGDYFGGNIPESDARAHWVEVVGGIKGELFRNFFIGWSFRARLMVSQTKNQQMTAYNIPGFGPGDRKSNIGFTYSIYYRIPIYKATPGKTN